MLLRSPLCVTVLFAGIVLASSDIPRLDVVNRLNGYHGLVNEDEVIVDVTPKIRAVGADICSFRIVNKHQAETPFEIVIKEREKGEAELRTKRLLNCEKKKNYKFDIAAVSCSGIASENVTVHVTVGDVNEYTPKFSEASYVVEVDEGRLEDKILQVDATDADCSPKYGDICRYEIVNNDQPFSIDYEGVIRNTEPLDYARSHNHILQVVAYDCGMKKSDPVLVTIKVNRVCRLGWTGIAERVDYKPGSGRQDLFPDAQLNLCDVPCQLESVQTRISLVTSGSVKTCDRDTYTVENQRKICGASSDSIDLLPSPGPTAEWTKDLTTNQNAEANLMYTFDGQTGAVVPADLMSHNLTRNFTVSVWLKHERQPGQDKHVKEHIICNADDHQMNRHHFALFVRNCRLILLNRREFGDGDSKSFRPAEWRWKLPQVCDGDWHHYAVSMEFPEARLLVDGQLFSGDKNNPEIIDDWPLHNSHGVNTTMTIGACWQGSQSRLQHFMRGSMAGLSVLIGKTEQPEVLACFHKCKENLEPPPMELLQPGMEILNNNDLTELTLEGDNKTNLESMFRKIAYANERDFPTPGKRPLRIATTIQCASGRALKIPVIESSVFVGTTLLPIISIFGNSSSHHKYEELVDGVTLFSDVRIQVSSAEEAIESSSEEDESEDEESDSDSKELPQRVDSCSVSVYPPLNPDHEILTCSSALAAKLNIEMKASPEGISLSGRDFTHHYEQILRQVKYNNHKPAYYLTRAFKLVCSQMNGRFLSNEHIHTVTVDHPQLIHMDHDVPVSTQGEAGTSSATSAATEASSSMSSSSSTTMKTPATTDSKTSTTTTARPQQIILRQHQGEVAPAHAQIAQHHVELRPAQVIPDVYMGAGMGIPGKITATLSAGSSHTVTTIVVVCAGFLIAMITLGVVRVRAARRRTQAEETAADTEMAWDDSALTITVNPMEQTIDSLEKATMTRGAMSADDSDSDGISQGNDSSDDEADDDEDDDTGHCGKSHDLEWDNSTLTI